MYLPALLHNSYFAIIICGLITISHATIDKQSQDTIIGGQRPASGSGAGGSNSYTSSQHARPHHQQQQYAYHQQQSKSHQTTMPPQPPSPSIHGGSGAHSDSISSRHNSYTLLSKAMSEAVNHEFSK